jgi:hypothetical protein
MKRMKRIAALAMAAVALPAAVATAQPPLHDIRALYNRALHERDAAEELAGRLTGRALAPLEAGYLGATYMIRARYGINPFWKYASFCAGRSLLDEAVGRDPHNAELRWLRYTIQSHAPRFLGYHQAVESDRAVLAASLNRLHGDTALQNAIAAVLDAAGRQRTAR